MNNNPKGAVNPTAPYDEKDNDYMEFEVLCSQSLSKTAIVFSNNYTPIVEKEIDDDSYLIPTVDYDTSNVDWKEEYHDDDHYTPYQLIELFKNYLTDILEGTDKIIKNPATLKYLISECEGWTVDEEVYEEG